MDRLSLEFSTHRLRGLPGARAGAIMRRDSRKLQSSRERKRGFYGTEG